MSKENEKSKEPEKVKESGDTKSVALVPAAGGTNDNAAVIHQCFALLLKVINDLYEELATPLPVVVKQTSGEVEGIASELSGVITRFAVFLSARPEADTIIPTSERLGNHLTAVMCSLRTWLSDAGPTRRKMIVDTGRKVLLGVKNLVVKMEEAILQTGAVAPHLTAAVWDQIKAINSIPPTNASAIGKQLIVFVSQIKDTKLELSEIKLIDPDTKSKGKEADDDDGDDDGGDDDFDDDFGDGEDDRPFTPSEYRIVAPVSDLVTYTLNTLKSIYVFILKMSTADDAQSARVEWFESVLRHSKSVSEWTDELGAAVYPPHEHKTLKKAANKLSDELNSLLSLLSAHAEYQSGRFDDIIRAEQQKQSGVQFAAAAAIAATAADTKSAPAAATAATAAAAPAAAGSGKTADVSKCAEGDKWVKNIRTKIETAITALLALTAPGSAAAAASPKTKK